MSEQAQVTQHGRVADELSRASALFAELVLRQTQLALMLLGKMPGPQTEEARPDLDQAQVAIELLEMLELKTKGNLTKEEENLLKQSLMTVRMAFVEAVEAAPAASGSSRQSQATGATDASQGQATAEQPQSEEQPRKRFVKKY
ncbi:MAG: DUF1844 domain-containing protein [Verrucomicrobiae bacterium]|nr:DUF1844 domain-containing protein [Verrucomicrobiae bacterium]MCX7722792.1 DUF1844 domain-containing protein [Verrucomicrobiae bacterium]MDW7980446.1 DUF1844 domain-containing protein [Verrucomicrobiales bacterium]